VRRRTFLVGATASIALVALAGACGGDDDDAAPTATTLPGPGAGNPDAVLLRTGAALSLAAADKNPDAAAAHRAHAALLDSSVDSAHPQALTTWATPVDAELAIAATFQAWVAVLSTPEHRQRIMAAGAVASRLYVVTLAAQNGNPPSLPESFQLTDPAVPDSWLLT
jgi:hypothetical protein